MDNKRSRGIEYVTAGQPVAPVVSGFGPLRMPTHSFAPLYFHLLSDEDLEELAGLLALLIEHRMDIVQRWYLMYAEHFGDARSLPQAEFIRLFEPTLQRNHSALMAGDLENYASGLTRLGALLAERGTPVEETIVAIRLFAESVRTSLFPMMSESTGAWAAFDRLCYVRIILLMRAYFQSQSAVSMERISAVEREGAPADCCTWFHGLIGASDSMRDLYSRIEKAASGDDCVLIVGEPGTGKESVARAIHAASPRSHKPFIAFSCSGVPDDLAEGELFGVDRPGGAEYVGSMRAAEGGTFFLDEITELGAATQVKLACALQQKVISPSTSARLYRADVRLVASSTRVPEEALTNGLLRSELYFLLRASVLKVPPLRERRGDLVPLVQHLIGVFNARLNRSVLGIDEGAMCAILQYPWPGNLWELSSAIEGAVAVARHHTIGLDDLPPSVVRYGSHSEASAAERLARIPVLSFPEMEKELIKRALETTGRNKLKAANLLRISRKKLYTKIKQHGL